MLSTKAVVFFNCALACVLAAPADLPPEKLQPTVIPIVSQSDELEPNGTYKFSYETGNGIKREEIAYEKVLPKSRDASSNEGGESNESDEIHVQQGSFSYTAPDGTIITLRYIADENGFQPIGDHLPRSPVPVQVASASAEKTGRALKKPVDSVESASAPVAAKPEKTIPPATEGKVNTETETKTKIEEPKTPSNEAATESSSPSASEATTSNVDVSTEAASTAVPAQSNTETEQASTASAEKASSTPPEQQTSTEITESPSSTSAPEQSSTVETVGQSTSAEAVNQSPADETEPSTNAPEPGSAEESSSTTVSA